MFLSKNKYSFFQKNSYVAIFGIFILLTTLKLQAYTDEEAKIINFSKETVTNYSKFSIKGTTWLTFRDVPLFVQKYVKGKKTLDFGCGAGRSTRFLKSLNLDPIGVDISQDFLKQAITANDGNHYFLIKDGKIPVPDNSYDFVFSSHVLLMIPSKEEMDLVFKEIYRVLKPGGIFLAVTSSEEMHSPKRKWISYETNFPENENYGSGSIVKLVIKGVNAVFYDYNWTNTDYLELLKHNKFEVLETHFPLGTKDDGYQWLSEKECSPYAMYIVQKKCDNEILALNK